jgi:hypothetical protein
MRYFLIQEQNMYPYRTGRIFESRMAVKIILSHGTVARAGGGGGMY